MRTMKADLHYNGLPEPIDSIEFDSTSMSEKEALEEIERQFLSKITIKYDEKNVFKKRVK